MSARQTVAADIEAIVELLSAALNRNSETSLRNAVVIARERAHAVAQDLRGEEEAPVDVAAILEEVRANRAETARMLDILEAHPLAKPEPHAWIVRKGFRRDKGAYLQVNATHSGRAWRGLPKLATQFTLEQAEGNALSVMSSGEVCRVVGVRKVKP